MTLVSTREAAAALGIHPDGVSGVGLVRVSRGFYARDSLEQVLAARRAKEQAKQAAKEAANRLEQAKQAAFFESLARQADAQIAREAARELRRREAEAVAAARRAERERKRQESAAVRAKRAAERLDRRRAQLATIALPGPVFADAPGDRVFAPARVERLVAELVEGDLLYSPPCHLATDDPLWFDSRKGQSPRWGELVGGLAKRGLRLVFEGAFYWRTACV